MNLRTFMLATIFFWPWQGSYGNIYNKTIWPQWPDITFTGKPFEQEYKMSFVPLTQSLDLSGMMLHFGTDKTERFEFSFHMGFVDFNLDPLEKTGSVTDNYPVSYSLQGLTCRGIGFLQVDGREEDRMNKVIVYSTKVILDRATSDMECPGMVKLGFGEFSEIDPLLKRIPMTVYIYDEVGDYSEQDDLYVGFVDRL